MKNKIFLSLVLIPTIFIFLISPVFAATSADISFPIYDSTSFSVGPLRPVPAYDSFSDSFQTFINDCSSNPENVYVKGDFNGYSRLYIYYFDKRPTKNDFVLFSNKTVNYLTTAGFNIRYVYFDLKTGNAQILNPLKLTDSRIYFPALNTPQMIFDFSFFNSMGFSTQEFTSRIPLFSYNNPSTRLKLNFYKETPPPISSEPASSQPVSSEPVSSEPASSEPVSSEPASSQPVSSEPVSSEPASSQPVSSEPASSEPASSKPVSSKPVSSQPTPPNVDKDLLGFTPSVFNKNSDVLKISIGNGVNIGFIVFFSVISILVVIRIIRHLLE